MIGTSLVLLKACCPMYNIGTSNMNYLNPCRLPHLQRQRVSYLEATKPKLKHCVYSSATFKDRTGLNIEEPEVSDAAAPYVLLGIGITCLASATALGAVVKFVYTKGWLEGVFKSKESYYLIVGVAALFAARKLFDNLMLGLAVLGTKLFAVGDIIQVGPLRGRVIDKGIITTSLLMAENRLAEVPTSWLKGQDVVNKSRTPELHPVKSEVFVKTDKIEKIREISEEIRDLMRSNPFVYMGKELPYCYLSGLEPLCITLSLGCYLTAVGEVKLDSVENDIHKQANQIIEKHGAVLGEDIKK